MESLNNIHDFENISNPLQTIGKINKFPIGLFPSPIENALITINHSLGFDKNYLALGALTTTSALIGNHGHIKVKDGWVTPCNIWGIVIGSSSLKKSPTLKMCTSPLSRLNQKAHEEYEKDLEKWKLDLADIEDKQERERFLIEHPEPGVKQFIIKDINQEALVKRFKDNPRGLLLFNSEILGWINSMDRYSKAGDQQYYLSLFDGDTINVDRAKTHICVQHPFLSVLGGVQPSKLHDLFGEGRKDDGFMYRFLFTFPESNDFTKLNKNNCPEALEVYKEYLSQIDHISRTIDLFTPFSLNPNAFELMAQKHDELLRQAKGSEHLNSLHGKLIGYLPKLALNYEFLHLNHHNIQKREISLEAMNRAVLTIDFFLLQANRAYAEVNSKINLQGEELEIYHALPIEFRTQNLLELVQAHHLPSRNYERKIGKGGSWIKEGLVKAISRGIYKKLK
ncbi:DUF3987 domain-containing protein [Persicobacter diffluens]|uniref:DUF3987 domain-containing protein n=1 Tax=Persicobacter diffluens TaxID=981 RepID=A0AAN4VZF3_9BACT|nr:hypothetical protein PEDI_17270 [Persicobacter diffluens]